MSDSPQFKCHVFICESCHSCDPQLPDYEAGEVSAWRKQLKKKLMEKYGKKDLRLNGSKCLGQCEQGISCVIYPQGRWLLGLKIGDDDKVIETVDKVMNE